MNSKLKINILYQILFQVFKIIIPFITTPIISRNLGVSNTGIYSYCHSIVQVFMFFSMLGISTYGTRVIAKDYLDKKKMEQDFWDIYLIEFISSIISIIAYIIFMLIFNKQYFIYAMIFVVELIGSLLDINWFYFGLEEFKMTAIRSMILRIVSCILIIIFVRKPADLVNYCLITSLETFFCNIILWGKLKKFVGKPKFVYTNLKEHIKPILMLFIPVISATIFKYIDKIMLGFFGLIDAVGLYEYIDKINNIPIAFILAFGTTLMPFICKIIKSGNIKKSKKYLDISMKVIMFLSIGFAFGLLFIANDFIPIFLGENYKIIVPFFNISVFSIATFAWRDTIKSQYLIPNGLEKINVFSMMIGAFVNIIFNFFLIPYLGLTGALVATVFSELATCSIQSYFIKNQISIVKYLVYTLCFSISGIIMYNSKILIPSFNNIIIIIIYKIIFGGIVYTVSSLILLKLCIIIKYKFNNHKNIYN